MFKKTLLCFILILLFPVFVYASEGSLLRIGNKYYDSFLEALANLGSNETIVLIDDVVLDNPVNINKTVNIDLNGNDIVSPEKVFIVDGGVLNLRGKGTIRESKPNYGAVMVIGSDNVNDKDYSIVNVSKDVTLEGWSGIFINHKNGTAYGVKVNFDGKIKSVNDTNGDTGIGIYVNGNIKNKENIPVVNILDNAYITSTGNGLYMAGNSTFNISSGYISGLESGIGIKSGNLNIDGATVLSEGPDKTPTGGYNNGIKASGTAIQIESNNGYPGDMNIDIDSGTFKSKNSNVVYEYIGKGTDTEVNSIDISGGTFISPDSKNVFLLSEPFMNKHSNFISGGSYSSNPSAYLKTGYNANLDDDFYNVSKSAMLEVIDLDNNNSNNSFKVIMIILSVIVILVIIYINRRRILNLFR